MIDAIINVALLSILALTALAVVRLRDLVAVTMLLGIYSLVSAAFFMAMDAVDVAFTEAAVGAGITTVLLLATLSLTHTKETVLKPVHGPSLTVVLIVGAGLVYGTLDMPKFGDPDNPVHQHVADRYIHESDHEVGPPNIVTSVIASYRGFDTFGETAVVFTAAVAVLLLLGTGDLKQRRKDS